MTKQVRRSPASKSGKNIPSTRKNNRLKFRYRLPAERLRENALQTMHLAITDALNVVDDIDVIAAEMFTYLGCAMNSTRHDPKQLGKYLIDQGNALLHPDACEDGPHLSQIAYLATAVGLFPELDEMRAKVAEALSSTPSKAD
jgi:hypothetical protein